MQMIEYVQNMFIPSKKILKHFIKSNQHFRYTNSRCLLDRGIKVERSIVAKTCFSKVWQVF